MLARHDLELGDAARLLGVPEEAVERWVRKGVLPFRMVDGEARFARSEVEAWAKGLGIRVQREGKRAAEAASATPLLDAIARGGLVLGVRGRDRRELFEAVLSRVSLHEGLAAVELCDRLLRREELGTTAVGDGVAIPHPRQPLGGYFQEPWAIVARLAEPMDFGALDGRPVSLLLILCSISVRKHLALLARAAHMLRDPVLRRAFDEAECLEELLARLGEGAR
ncbi:MAG: PTS sugar transporter subunit IIA [Planctomycetota bacterium]